MSQHVLGEYSGDSPHDGPAVFIHYCWSCEQTFRFPSTDPDCPDCGAKVCQPCGFVGGADLARRIEAIRDRLPDRVDVSRLSRGPALDLLERYE